MRCGLVLLGLVLVVAGCGSKSPPIGVTCVRNTDCQNPLSCTFGKCHETCREARDCPDGHRCIAVAGAGVCQLEGKCAYLSECPEPLVCALDRQCRSQCREDKDCATPTQKCLRPDNVCAEPAEIDPSGAKLKNGQATPVPAAPDGGVLDTSVPAPGDSGTPPLDTTTPFKTEAGAPPDAPLVVDAMPDVNLGDLPVGPCGFQDPNEPTNDRRESATPLPTGTPILGCVSGKDPTVDGDFFELVAPDDPAGGYFQVAVTDVGDGRVGITTYAASDNGIILDAFGAPDQGGSANAFFAAAPGQHYRILISQGTYDFLYKQPFRYTIKASYTKINDTYEPNDTRAAAKPISVGTPISAYAFGGFTTGHTGVANTRLGAVPTADWYKVEITGAMLKATVENTAGDVHIALLAYDSLGVEKARADSNTLGAGTSVMIPATAGTYYIQVLAGEPGPVAANAGLTVSPSFTMPYTLTVTQ